MHKAVKNYFRELHFQEIPFCEITEREEPHFAMPNGANYNLKNEL